MKQHVFTIQSQNCKFSSPINISARDRPLEVCEQNNERTVVQWDPLTGDKLTTDYLAWFLAGEGRRHMVFSNGVKVLRVQKVQEDNNLVHLEQALVFHESFVSKLFAGFVCPVSPRRCEEQFVMHILKSATPESNLCCIETCFLRSKFSVELKPKCAIIERPGYPSRFVLQQHEKGEVPIYDPTAIWTLSNEQATLEALKLASVHPKKYLRIHSWSGTESLEKVCEALHSSSGKDLIDRLSRLQQFGTDTEAKRAFDIWKEMGHPNDILQLEQVFDRMTSSSPAGTDIGLFLAARMAMDVSLIFNFYPPSCETDAKCDHLVAIALKDGWVCHVGVVDTDLKHSWKIPEYATQLDRIIDSLATRSNQFNT